MVKKLLTYGTPKRLFVSGSPKLLTSGEAECECCYVCDGCQYDTRPAQMQVEIPALTDDTCSDCESFAGSYILDYHDAYSRQINVCVYLYKFPSPICGLSYLQLNIDIEPYLSPKWRVWVSIKNQAPTYNTAHYLSWHRADGNVAKDCNAFDSYEVPSQLYSTECSVPSSSFITSLP